MNSNLSEQNGMTYRTIRNPDSRKEKATYSRKKVDSGKERMGSEGNVPFKQSQEGSAVIENNGRGFCFFSLFLSVSLSLSLPPQEEG